MDTGEMFFKYEYSETKDLLKTFITLVSGTIVVSVAFAEKIVDFRNAVGSPKRWLIACWGFLISSIIFCGISMCLIAAAAGKAIYDNIPLVGVEVAPLALASWAFVIAAGGTFVGGLISMILAAFRSMQRVAAESHPKLGEDSCEANNTLR